MQYALLSKVVKNIDGSNGSTVTLDRDVFLEVLNAALSTCSQFDESYYLKSNLDIKRAVDVGELKSGLSHYLKTGYFEDRLPGKVLVDENFYLSSNPDLKKAAEAGVIRDVQIHFESNGYLEGRVPYAGFCLWNIL